MSVDEVYILGSGESVSNLTAEEKQHINNARHRIALNKFMAYYDLSGLQPTAVFFLDAFSDSAQLTLQQIFDRCRRDGLAGLTFVINKSLQPVLSHSAGHDLLKRAVNRWRKQQRRTFIAPRRCHYQFLEHHKWTTGGEWASSLDEPLYHFRGSLTSALNYATIIAPGSNIKLVGTDFNTTRYFYQQALEESGVPFRDWTTDISRKNGVHFSAVPVEGETMFDRFHEVLEHLESCGNRIGCCNPSSMLVEKQLVPYQPVLT